MVTWYKKLMRSKVTKSLAMMGMIFLAIIIGSQGPAIYQGLSHDMGADNYLETWSFEAGILAPKAGYVRDWIVRYPDDSVFKEENVNLKEYEHYFKVPEQEEPLAPVLSKEEREQEEARVRDQVVKDRQIYYRKIQKELMTDNVNIEFVARNNTTGQVISNVIASTATDDEVNHVIKRLEGQPGYLLGDEMSYYKNHGYNTASSYFREDIVRALVSDDYEIHVAVADTLRSGDELYDRFYEFEATKEGFERALRNIAICIPFMIILLGYFTVVAGKQSEDESIKLIGFDRIPFEIQGIALGILAVLSVVIVDGLLSNSYYTGKPSEYVSFYGICCAGIFVVDVLSGMTVYLSVVRHLKNHTFWNNTVAGKVYRRLRGSIGSLFGEKMLLLGLGIGLIAYVGVSFFVCVMFSFHPTLLFIYMSISGGMGAVLLGVLAVELKHIIKGTKRIEQGELDYQIKGYTGIPVFKELIGSINNIGEGLANSVDEALKSEMMKTELITNVSHDLKTPLTSIISYIDLLKDEPIENEQAKEYIEVLSERGERLKVLIQDLVDASKAATGNVTVELETVELTQFVQQAIGEYNDRLGNANLNVVLNEASEVLIRADGRHMWRIMENLLSNTVKYAMPYTRVYVEVSKEQNMGIMTIKNISQEQLSIDSGSLTERFVRGDASRSTEGSGLGLSIAESLTKLQGGALKVSVDGDLFKVQISIPLGQ